LTLTRLENLTILW